VENNHIEKNGQEGRAGRRKWKWLGLVSEEVRKMIPIRFESNGLI